MGLMTDLDEKEIKNLMMVTPKTQTKIAKRVTPDAKFIKGPLAPIGEG